MSQPIITIHAERKVFDCSVGTVLAGIIFCGC